MEKEKQTSLYVYRDVKAALNILAQEETIKTGKRITPNDMIWKLIKDKRPDVADQVDAAKKAV